MTTTSCTAAVGTDRAPAAEPPERAGDAVAAEVDTDAEGWHALADAELGRPLTATELAAAERLPPAEALALLFPALSDEARHEALWALAR